jgi:superfamily I DNA and/or RNA helicase
MGVASNALMYARDHREDPVCIDFLKKLDDYKQQGLLIEREARKDLTESIKQVFALVKKRADVQGATANSLGHASNGVAIGEVDLLIIDEIGMMTFSEFCLVVASIDVNNIIGIGDETQLQPMVPMVLPTGCTREISQSILHYFLLNHWPTESLNLQRRGVPGIMKIASNLFYQGRLLDAPCTSAPEKLAKAIEIRDWFNNKFPECQSQEFFRYLLVQGHNELRDENTGSYYNLDCASVVTHLATEMIKDRIITAKQESIITHYTAQQRVYDHAFIQCDIAQPGFNFADVLNYTTDEFQGDDNLVIFGDSVRTDGQGFTSNNGRNNVMATRAKNFCVGNVQYLRPVNDRAPPAVIKRAFDKAKKLKTCITITVEGPYNYLLKH